MNNKFEIYHDGDWLGENIPSELRKYLLSNRMTTLSGKSIQFVGVVELEKTYFILPKRFNNNGNVEQISLILKVLNKFSGKARKLEVPNCIIGRGTIGKKINLAFGILSDWLHNGMIKDTVKRHKKNGTGKINWKRTLDKHLPIDSNGSPIYLDYETTIVQNQLNSRVALIHKKVVSSCDKSYHWLLSENYIARDVHHYNFNKKEIKQDILFLREFARGVFCERTLNLIKMMIDYMSLTNISSKRSEYAYGTQSFHVLWEDICNVTLGGENTLKELFQQPKYRFKESIHRQKPKAFIGQIPDTLVMRDGTLFVIDAKYYDIKRKSPPGWSDLVKQFYYGWSSTLNNDIKLRNILAFPGEDYCHVGEVFMEDDHREYTELGVVECLEVPIIDFMRAYIKNDSSTYLENILYETSVEQ